MRETWEEAQKNVRGTSDRLERSVQHGWGEEKWKLRLLQVFLILSLLKAVIVRLVIKRQLCFCRKFKFWVENFPNPIPNKRFELKNESVTAKEKPSFYRKTIISNGKNRGKIAETRRKMHFFEKNRPNIWRFQENVVPLQSQTDKECTTRESATRLAPFKSSRAWSQQR